MLETMARYWWVPMIRGAVAILFGLLAWIWPGITVLALLVLFGAYALVDGVFALAGAVRGVPGQSRGWLVVGGICGIALGLMTFAWPGVTGLVLLTLIAAWALVTGVFEIMAAIRMRHEIRGAGWYVAGGVVSLVFGILLLAWPVSGALAVIWMIGLFSILYGAAMVGAAFRLRKASRKGRRGSRVSPGGAAPAAT